MNKAPKTSTVLLKLAFCVCLSVIGILILTNISFCAWMKWENRFPSEQQVRAQFESHKADFIRFATLLKTDPTARCIGSDGGVNTGRTNKRQVPEYRNLAHEIGAKCVIIGEDGSMEFQLGGFGGAIMSDSYMGVFYSPKHKKFDSRPGWSPMVVTSLASAKLPQENGQVATGLYVVPIETEWSIYRFEYQE